MPAESDPYVMFDRVFAGVGTGGMGDTMAIDKLRAERRSLLDYVKQDLADVKLKVGKTDQLKIDAHIEGTRDIERRLDSAGGKMIGAVTRPDGGIALDSNVNFPKILPVMNKLLVSDAGGGPHARGDHAVLARVLAGEARLAGGQGTAPLPVAQDQREAGPGGHPEVVHGPHQRPAGRS